MGQQQPGYGRRRMHGLAGYSERERFQAGHVETRRRILPPAVAGLLALGLAISACGSSSSSTSTTASSPASSTPSSSAPTTASTPSGPPIKLGIYEPIASNPAGNSYPDTLAAVKAAVRAINATGGIHGSSVEVDFCDPKEDPNVAAACARQFVNDHVVAVVGSFSAVDSTVTPVLAAAKIPNVGALLYSGQTDTDEFPLDAGTAGGYLAAPAICKAAGSSKIGAIGYNIAAAQGLIPVIKEGAKAAGTPFVSNVEIPLAAPSVSSYVASAVGQGANCAITLAIGSDDVRLVLAAKQLGANIRFATNDSSLTGALIKQLGDSTAAGILGVALYPEPTATGFPLITEFNNQMDTELATGDQGAAKDLRTSAITFRAWLSVYVVDEVLKTLPAGTSASQLNTALNTDPSISIGNVGPSLTWTKAGPIPGFPRNVNTEVYEAVINSQGQWVLTSQTPINTGTIASSAG
jgi:ABC-type branched-subunit amino acid transport system substrate-binding protein